MAEEKEKFAPFVSVDIGSYSIKFAFVETDDEGKPILKALSQIEIPPYEHELTEDQLETMSKDDVVQYSLKKLRQLLTTHLTELLYDNEIQTKSCFTFASNREVTVRYIEIPPVVEKDKLLDAVTAEANKQMPFSMGNAVLGYQELGDVVKDDKAMTQLMVAALQKDVIDVIAQNIKGGGLVNDGILTLPQALEVALASQLKPYSENDKKVAIIHSGNSTTSIMIYKNGKLQFFRDVNMAGGMITDAIFKGGEFEGSEIKFKDQKEAIELKHKIGVLPPDEAQNLKGNEKFVAVKIFESVEKIFQHIQLSISFYISQSGESQINKIILSGGTAGMINFKEFIEESLEVPTELAKPFDHLAKGDINYEKERLGTDAPGLSPCVGVALHKGEKHIINFIEILFPNRRQSSGGVSGVSSKFSGNISGNLSSFFSNLDETKLRIIAGLIGALCLLIGAYPVVKIKQAVATAKSDYKKLRKDLSRLNSANGEVGRLLAEQEKLKKFSRLGADLKALQIKNSVLILEIAKITPKQIFLTKAAINSEGEAPSYRFEGHSDNSDRVFDFLSIIGKSDYFLTPNLEATTEIPIDDELYFIKFAINGKINMKKLNPPLPEDDFEEDY